MNTMTSAQVVQANMMAKVVELADALREQLGHDTLMIIHEDLVRGIDLGISVELGTRFGVEVWRWRVLNEYPHQQVEESGVADDIEVAIVAACMVAVGKVFAAGSL